MDLFRYKNLHHLTSEILVVNGIFPEILKNVYCFRRQKNTSKKKTFYRGIIKTVKVKIPLLFW